MATPVPATAATTLSSTRRRTAHPVPSARMAYTRHATAGDQDDRIIANALDVFYKFMAIGGGVAILAWILFGGFNWGRATAPTSSTPTASKPQVVYVSPAVPVAQPAPPPSQRELTPEERAEQYKEERRRQYGIR